MTVREIAAQEAKQFDSTICHNIVYESIQGQHEHGSDLQRFVKIVEEIYMLAHDSRDKDRGSDIFGAAETINGYRDEIVEEAIASALSDLLEVVGDWDDHWSDEEIAAAKHEAREWLQANREAAKRADVWQEVTA